MTEVISWFLVILTRSPINPHWLHNLKHGQATRRTLADLIKPQQKKRLLEVGAGDGTTKEVVMKQYPKLDYVATDFSSWDEEFEAINKKTGRYGKIGQVLLNFQPRKPLDVVCDAMDLPFKEGEFDYHLSLETLEHLNSPESYYHEASRVLKKGGYAIVSVPFMFRMHGGEPDHKMDYFRYGNGFFYDIAEKTNMQVERIYSNTGIGTTITVMFNQWLILLFGNQVRHKLLASFVFSPVFFVTNIVGYLIDLRPDQRFTTRMYVVLKKL